MNNIEFTAAALSAAFLMVDSVCLLDRANRGEEVKTSHLIIMLFAAVALEAAIGCCLAN